jgi:ferritin-like metal-binding protein YciE
MDIHDYFAARCYERLQRERGLLAVGDEIEKEVANPRLKAMYQHHAEVAQQGILNLNRVVDRLGGEEHLRAPEGALHKFLSSLGAGGSDDRATQAIREEHTAFLDEKPPRNLIDLNAAIELVKLRTTEISAYGTLAALAQQLGEKEIAKLLQENRQSDTEMHRELDRDFRAVLPELIGGEERGQLAA